MTKSRQELREELIDLDIDVVEASYSGSGDSGDFDALECFSKEDGDKLALGKQAGIVLREQLLDFFWAIVDFYHAGWENNEGGYGTITWHVIEDTIEHDHSDYIQTTEDHSYEYGPDWDFE